MRGCMGAVLLLSCNGRSLRTELRIRFRVRRIGHHFSRRLPNGLEFSACPVQAMRRARRGCER